MVNILAEKLIAGLEVIPDEIEQILRSAASIPSVRVNWTAPEILGHLNESALIWGLRIRRAIYPGPLVLEAIDVDLAVRQMSYQYMSPAVLLNELRPLSQANVHFLRGIPDPVWTRLVVQTFYRRVTLRDMVSIEIYHEQKHVFEDLRYSLGLPKVIIENTLI